MKPRSIPPITSTGINRSNQPAKLQGLAHMSLGRYMSEVAKNKRAEEENETWHIPKYTNSGFTEKKKIKDIKQVKHNTLPAINCIISMIDDYDMEGNFAIEMQCKGFEFMSTQFERIENSSLCYTIPIEYLKKPATLCIMTVGDIFEYEIVSYNGKIVRICCDEVYIPKLLQTFDSLSMQVLLKDNCVIVTYKRK